MILQRQLVRHLCSLGDGAHSLNQSGATDVVRCDAMQCSVLHLPPPWICPHCICDPMRGLDTWLTGELSQRVTTVLSIYYYILIQIYHFNVLSYMTI